MSDENSPLELLSSESSWIEIDAPSPDDDDRIIGYFRDAPIRVSNIPDEGDDSLLEFHSGPYEITMIAEGDKRMVFVDRQRIEVQNRDRPTGRLTAYGGQVTLTIPEKIVEEDDIRPGDRYWMSVEAENGTANLRFDDDGQVSVSVSESFNSDQMEHEYEFRLGKFVGKTLDVDDDEAQCEWVLGDATMMAETNIELEEPAITERDIRGRDPVKVRFEAGKGVSQYALTIPNDHAIVDDVRDEQGLTFYIASYNDKTILKGVPQPSPAGSDFSRTVFDEGDDGASFGIPERVGDLLRVYDRAWLRLYFLDGVLYGVPTETYGPAPAIS